MPITKGLVVARQYLQARTLLLSTGHYKQLQPLFLVQSRTKVFLSYSSYDLLVLSMIHLAFKFSRSPAA